jgi:hypothetical protein
MQRIAQCQCGSLRAIATGDPDLVNVCHCVACQRRTGAIMHSGAYYKRTAVRPEGDSKVFARATESGRTIHFHFCPNCGSSVYWEADLRPDHYGVAVGAFADPNFPMPSYSVWEQTKHAWIDLPPALQHFPKGRN